MRLTAGAILLACPLTSGQVRSFGVQAQSLPRFRLGPADARVTQTFEYIGAVRELADGRVLVADVFANTLYVVDLGRDVARIIGRAGDGPGEYRSVSSLHAGGKDSTLMEDHDGGRWLLLDGDRPVAGTNAVQVFGHQPVLQGIDCQGRVLEVRGFKFGTPPDGRPIFIRSAAESLLVIASPRSGTEPDTIARIRGPFRGWNEIRSPLGTGTMVTWIPNPLDVEDQALMYCDGWIAIVYADPYRVDRYPPQGRRVAGSPLPFQRAPVDETVKQRAIEASRAHRGRFSARQVKGWPSFLPPFLNGALVGMPDGRLVIRRAAGTLRGQNLYDVVDRRGALTASLVIAPNERIVGFGATFVYVATPDGDGIERLSRHPLL
jgi:hypothetical protein